jgi:hypothetical protein
MSDKPVNDLRRRLIADMTIRTSATRRSATISGMLRPLRAWHRREPLRIFGKLSNDPPFVINAPFLHEKTPAYYDRGLLTLGGFAP